MSSAIMKDAEGKGPRMPPKAVYDVSKRWDEDEEEKIGFLERLFGQLAGDEDKKEGTLIKEHLEGDEAEIVKTEGDDDPEKDGGKKESGGFSLRSLLPKGPGAQSTKGTKESAGAEDGKKPKDSFEKSFSALLFGKTKAKSVGDIVVQAREMTQEDTVTKATLSDVLQAGKTALERLDATMDGLFGGKEPPPLGPPNLYYWIEREEATKNFAWKRRKHRFCKALEVSAVEELDQMLHFANLCYADTVDEIKDELEGTFGYELLYCSMESQANMPSHFVAIKRDQPARRTEPLQVILVVRGTKTVTDVITDILCEEAEYRGGTAHAGMLESGRYLAEKHKAFFRQLCDLSERPKIGLTIIGHSLGAGAASIAGIELNDEDYIDVQVFGFGAPATVSKELSEAAKPYITTVIADSDCVPRMSAATMGNAVLDMGEYDWVPDSRRDMQQAIDHIHASENVPSLLKGDKATMMDLAEKLLIGSVVIPEATSVRLTPTLFPPGKCVHFYRDGVGMSAVTVPCTFFDELDINMRMVDDHLYHTGYKQALLEFMRQHCGDHFYEFETDRLTKAARAAKAASKV